MAIGPEPEFHHASASAKQILRHDYPDSCIDLPSTASIDARSLCVSESLPGIIEHFSSPSVIHISLVFRPAFKNFNHCAVPRRDGRFPDTIEPPLRNENVTSVTAPRILPRGPLRIYPTKLPAMAISFAKCLPCPPLKQFQNDRQCKMPRLTRSYPFHIRIRTS